MKRIFFLTAIVILLFTTFGISAQQTVSEYIVVVNGNNTGKLASAISSAGGTMTRFLPQIGVAVATSSDPAFASNVKGVSAVLPNIAVYGIRPGQQVAIEPEAGFPPNSGDDDFFFDLQWGHNAVRAQQAWAAGVTGQGVRVAVLDGGFDMDHPDLAPNINYALSTDFTGEGIDYGPNPDDPTGVFSHGSHVAGTIAAADNGFGIIGIAPNAELVLVKVLENIGSGSFADVLSGIIYAADVDADVINMSLGADIPQGIGPGSNEVAQLRSVFNRAISYAYQSGATVIVAAGNDARDLDHDQSTVVFPAAMPHALSISATAPIGWATDPANISLDNLASYSNYGRSGVDFAAPGGDFIYPGNENCTVAGLVRPCWVLDFVFSTGNGSWYWSVGTSMAAPHASGIAALIISENGGDMHPAQVEAQMRQRAADLGQPGNDPAYGLGRVSSGY